jgi:hypothetical protein
MLLQALALSPGNVKGHYRKGVALLFLERPEEAAQTLRLGLQLAPRSRQLRGSLQEAEARVRDDFHKHRESAASAARVEWFELLEARVSLAVFFLLLSGRADPFLPLVLLCQGSGWGRGSL